jgi:hypothetical protein
MDPLTTFRDYIGLKVHFNVWDFNWLSIKTKALLPSALDKRNDKNLFVALTRTYPKPEDRRELFITSFLINRNTWIGDIFHEELKTDHYKRMIKSRSLIYTVNNDLENIYDFMLDEHYTFKELLLTNEQRPKLLKFKNRIPGGVTDETIAIIDTLFGFTKYSSNNPLWNEERLKYHKYGFLLKIDELKQIKPNLTKLLAHS